ncbi:MAG: OmpA family protein [Saprospiraceae bacterium]|nr:OmpA family protein [Saprospiraceae bacterium]MDW8229952.1 OmpA family protein [Saprospiraceae bacterium]
MCLRHWKNVCLLAALLALSHTLCAQHFRVQVLASLDSLPMTYFTQRGLKNVWRTTDAAGIHHYYFGSYPTRLEAEKVRQQVAERGFEYATIIDVEEQRLLADRERCAYFKGGPLPLAESDTVRFVYFETGKTVLSDAGKKHALHMLHLLKSVPGSCLYILGYADAVGAALVNMELAAERARVVRNFLLENNIAVERLRLYAYGETEAGVQEMREDMQNDYEGAELRKRFRCAVLIWRRQP